MCYFLQQQRHLTAHVEKAIVIGQWNSYIFLNPLHKAREKGTSVLWIDPMNIDVLYFGGNYCLFWHVATACFNTVYYFRNYSFEPEFI